MRSRVNQLVVCCLFTSVFAPPVFSGNISAADCVVLNRITLDEHEILKQGDQQKLFKPYLGKCIDGKLLKTIIAGVSDFYIKRGYITTRPYLKKQSISDGQIDIHVLKGIVEDIVDAATHTSSARIKTAFAFQKDRPLNLKDIETALEMTNRPPSSDARFAIKPGDKPGASIIEVKYRDFPPWRLKLGLTGRRQAERKETFLTGEVAWDNLLNINDILTFRLNGNRVLQEQQSTRAGELNYAFPVSDYLLEFIASRFSHQQGVQGVNETFLANGHTDGLRTKVGKVLMRDQTHKINAAFSIYHKRSRNFLAGQLIQVSSYKTTLAQLDVTHTWLQHWGSLTTTYSYYQGTDWFGARKDSFFDAQTGASGQARLQFKKHTLGLNLDYRFPNKRYQFTSQAYLQYTADQLFDNDKLSIGGDYTVQGYVDGSLYGNNAWYVRNKLMASWGAMLHFATLESFAGFDYGRVKCESDNPLSCGTIYGLATGLSSQGHHFTSILTVGWPLKKISSTFKRTATLRLDTTWIF